MKIEHIPVLLNMGDQAPIGFGTIENGELTIVVKNQLLVDLIAHLTKAEDIKELYLGMGFPVNPNVTFTEVKKEVGILQGDRLARISEMKSSGYSNAEIADHLGLSENTVSSIAKEK